MAAANPAGSPAARGWLFGPVPDLLFGCGVAYGLLFTLQVVAGPQMREWIPLSYQALLTLLLGGPHYGATLLRVYERREDRRKYAFFAVWLTLALAVVYLAGLRWAVVGSWTVTLYLTWSPWHYSGQNYGIAVMFLRRRKVAISPLCKRLLYGAFLSSYALVFLTLHGLDPSSNYAPATYQGTIYSFVRIGIPAQVAMPLLVAALAVFVACSLGAVGMLMRHASLRTLFPALVLLAVQTMWFLLPSTARYTSFLSSVDPFANANAAYTFMWVAVGHFLQYLWITSFYATRTGSDQKQWHFLLKALLVGVALWSVPLLLFAPGVLGSLPVDMGLGLLTAAVVNLHHFVLDGAIWKLRDGRISRVLLRSERENVPEPIGPRRVPGWVRAAAWTGGAVVLVASVMVRVEGLAYGSALRAQDTQRARDSIARLRALGHESPSHHLGLARLALARDLLDAAMREIDLSLAVHPTPEAWNLTAQVHERRNDWLAALEAYDTALELDASNVTALYRSGRALLRLGRPEQARERLAQAASMAPEHALIRRYHERAVRQAQESG